MQFKDVIGQAEVKKQLIQMVQNNRLSHALLFLGKEGSGALSLARAFTQYLVCEKVNGINTSSNSTSSLFAEQTEEESQSAHNSEIVDSCGVCPACMKASGMVHPDIHFSYPVISRKSGDKPVSTDFLNEWRIFMKAHPYGNLFDWLQAIGAENKQGNITAAECNDINRKLSLKSFESEYKFLLMWMPELLGNQGNKLLKLIEEPPPNTVFIFVAEHEQLILPTILSRTQLVKIPLLSRSDIKSALQSSGNLSPQQAEQIALSSEGNYHDALNHLEHSEENWDEMLRGWMNSILKTGPVAQVKWVEDISKLGREKQKQFLRYFIQLLEYSIRISIADPNSDSSSPFTDFALKMNKITGITQQEAIVEELDKATYYIERNANAKMLFHALTIKLYHIISNKSVILVN